MSVVLITGSTRGIGFGMAQEFLKCGWSVFINGRSPSNLDEALNSLRNSYESSRISGAVADMRNYDEVQALWDTAVKQFGKVDYWVNNAGIDLDSSLYWELEAEQFRNLIEINLLGVMNASHIALKGMLKQGEGQIFNMEGFGSDGRKMPGLSSYGASKCALRYFTQSLALEVAETPVKVSTISPGIVITDLLIERYEKPSTEWERAKRIFNILADKVEPVAHFLVKEMIANEKNNASIAWLTSPKIAWRFMTSVIIKRNLFEDMEIH